MSSGDPLLAEELQRCLLDSAMHSIEHGVETGAPMRIDVSAYPPELQTHRASFVTLQIDNALRGCIGNLEASRPLISDVVDNAFSAAFRDPRFRPVSRSEYKQLDIHISILSAPESLDFRDEDDLRQRIRPGIDGLILEADGRRGTFLPSVWDSLPDTESFLRHLKLKAGLPETYWSEDLRVWRYTATPVPAQP